MNTGRVHMGCSFFQQNIFVYMFADDKGTEIRSLSSSQNGS